MSSCSPRLLATRIHIVSVLTLASERMAYKRMAYKRMAYKRGSADLPIERKIILGRKRTCWVFSMAQEKGAYRRVRYTCITYVLRVPSRKIIIANMATTCINNLE